MNFNKVTDQVIPAQGAADPPRFSVLLGCSDWLALSVLAGSGLFWIWPFIGLREAIFVSGVRVIIKVFQLTFLLAACWVVIRAGCWFRNLVRQALVGAAIGSTLGVLCVLMPMAVSHSDNSLMPLFLLVTTPSGAVLGGVLGSMYWYFREF